MKMNFSLQERERGRERKRKRTNEREREREAFDSVFALACLDFGTNLFKG